MARRARVKMPSATSVVARSYPDHVIGIENRLPWRLKTDLLHFKKLTLGHAVIMGRKTFESLGKPLPNRLNIVLSREIGPDSGNVQWARDIPTALMIADVHSICNFRKQFFVIGGEIIYRAFEIYINKVWLTEVFSGPMQGDAAFNYEFKNTEWWTPYEMDHRASDDDEYAFRISCKIRRKQFHRERSRDEFMKYDEGIINLLDEWQDFIESTDSEEQLSLF